MEVECRLFVVYTCQKCPYAMQYENGRANKSGGYCSLTGGTIEPVDYMKVMEWCPLPKIKEKIKL